MNQEIENPVLSKQVIEMITVANDFCLFIEKFEDYSLDYSLSYLQRMLPLLYIKGSLLPEIEVTDETANERFVTEENWDGIFSMIKEKLGANDEYWIVNDDIIEGVKPIKASIADNLADIYQDTKDFVMLYQKNLTVAKENAAWQVKYLFYTHWGSRCVNALGYIHSIIEKGIQAADNDGTNTFI